MANPPWVQAALAEQGQAEIVGRQHNSRIVAYHATTTLGARDDETPWCASFVGWCLQKAGLTMTRSVAASSYSAWGVKLDAPVLGAIVTFTRAGGGHVGFYMGQADGKWLILGGNQSNRVSVIPYDPMKVTAIRWPSGVPLPVAAAPLSKSGVIQGNTLAAAATVIAMVGQASGEIPAGHLLVAGLGLVAMVGIAWAVISRINGKKAAVADEVAVDPL